MAKKDDDKKKKGDAGQNGGDPQQDPPAEGDPLNITQAALDKMMGERADRAARTAVSKFLSDLGYDDPDQVKTDLGDLKKIKDGEKSELEKAQDGVLTETKRADDSESALATARQELDEFKKRTALTEAAREKGFLDESLDDVWLLASANGDYADALTIDEDDGEVKGAKDVVAKIAKAKAHWLQTSNKRTPPGGRSSSPPKRKQQSGQGDEAPEGSLVQM